MRIDIVNLDSLSIDGLNVHQIRALASFYETTTGRKPEEIEPERIIPEGIPDPDYKSPCPEGYDTIVGYLTEYEPGMWEIMDAYAEATQRDGWWLMHRCRERGITPIRVPAPPWLVRQGIFEVNSYPIDLLRERFSS